MKRLFLLMMVFAVITSCGKKEKASEEMFISAENCVDCHAPIYDEWKTSMHANSAPMNDKVFAALFKMAGNDVKTGTKDGSMPVCVKCHVPVAAMEGEVDLTKKPVYAEGVTCTFCHKIWKPKEMDARGIGADYYNYLSDDFLASALSEAKPEAHGAKYIGFYEESEYCNGCHEKQTNGRGVSVCNTYEEFKTSRQAKFMQCQNCHMPSKDGRIAASSVVSVKRHFHGNTGGHNTDTLKGSVELYVDLNKSGKNFNVVIKNKNAAHRLPTAAPLRQLFVKVTQLDGKGGIVKTNFVKSVKEDKNALFMVAFKDIDGNIGVPPWKAESIAFDKRLKPGEERIIIYELAGGNVKKIRAELFYRLVPEEFSKDEGFDEYTKKSHLIAVKEVDVGKK